jgi:quercetin dioxygenase-like cupin family protein
MFVFSTLAVVSCGKDDDHDDHDHDDHDHIAYVVKG